MNKKCLLSYRTLYKPAKPPRRNNNNNNNDRYNYESNQQGATILVNP